MADEIIIDLAMPNFLWSGRTASGEEGVEEVNAETALEARRMLEARGWTELRQHTSEVHDFARRQMRESNPSMEQAKSTPKESLQYHEGTAPGLWGSWLKSLQESALLILLLVGGLVWVIFYRGTSGHGIKIGFFAVSLVVLIFLQPVLHWWFQRSKRLFVKLHTARTWRRWDEVLRCLDELSQAQRTTKIGIGDFEMARYRALAFAGLGRLDEALTVYCAAAEKAQAPAWLGHSFQAGIHVIARQYDKALECYRVALTEAPDKSTVCLDLGMLLVQRFNLPGEARQFLAQAETAQLSELARVYLPYLRGAIAFREKDFATVDKNIREALAGFEKQAANKYYIFEASILTCKGYLAVSSAALGRSDQARRYFAESEPYLTVIGLDALVAQYHVFLKNTEK
jgi:hypothetical protein